MIGPAGIAGIRRSVVAGWARLAVVPRRLYRVMGDG